MLNLYRFFLQENPLVVDAPFGYEPNCEKDGRFQVHGTVLIQTEVQHWRRTTLTIPAAERGWIVGAKHQVATSSRMKTEDTLFLEIYLRNYKKLKNLAAAVFSQRGRTC